MERASKLLVLTWTAFALAADVWLLRGGWPALPMIALAVFAGAAVLAIVDRRTVAAVLVFSYVVPILVYWFLGRYVAQYSVVWMAALFGAIVPASARIAWQIPARWRGPLVAWALMVAAGASVVLLREIDFTPALIDVTTVANTPGGGWPSFVISWVLHVSVGLLLGILWFDWLLAFPAERFHVSIATPLAISAAAMAGVAIYQLFVDMSFLNATVYLSLGRASGTMQDSNVCGTIAALWIGAAVLWARKFSHAVAAAGIAIFWLAVWATGSRTAFAAALITTVFVLRGYYAARVTKAAVAQVALGAAALCALLFVLATTDLGAIGPLARFRATLPSASAGDVGSFLAEQVWNRNRYGTTSTAMIREHPLFGVGIGSFQLLLPEFAVRSGGALPPDNAQNWYRHQIAEFGVIGSLAWIAWLVAFIPFVLRRTRPEDDGRFVWSARGALVAFGAISFVGMPGQDIAVALTVWTIAAWYVRHRDRGLTPISEPLRLSTWAIIAAVLILYTAGAVHAATHDLRVPMRAKRVGWLYSYGFYPPEPGIGDGDFRWTQQRAVAVVPAPARWIELTVSVDYRAIANASTERRLAQAQTRPVDVRIWRDGELVLEKRLTTTEPVTTRVPVPEGDRWVFIETWASRTFKPRDLGLADDRELGLLTRWTFVDAPP